MENQTSRLGLALFFLYLLLYGAFVVINAYTPEVMERRVGGVNLAVVYGFGLIVVALLLSLVYGWLSRGGDAE